MVAFMGPGHRAVLVACKMITGIILFAILVEFSSRPRTASVAEMVSLTLA